MLTDVIERARLPFRKDKRLRLSLYQILGFYPHNIAHYKLALMHKSMAQRNEKGRPLNNERLEFLGDAILDAAVGDIVYRHFPGKREGFLTNVRSKLVKRETLNRLAEETGLMSLLHANKCGSSHNSYVGGNAFEALVGAVYVDRGYNACMRFIERRILKQALNIDKVAYKETNFKSRLIEWCQKNRVKLEFRLLKQSHDKRGNTVFNYAATLNGVEGATGTGYSKKESQQQASKFTLTKLRREPQFIDEVYASRKSIDNTAAAQGAERKDTAGRRGDRVCVDPNWESGRRRGLKKKPQDKSDTADEPQLSDSQTPQEGGEVCRDSIRETDPSREDIIAKAEEMAFAGQ